MSSSKILRQLVMLNTAAVLAFGAQAAQASNVGVDLDIHLGNQPRTVVVPQPVYVAPQPVYVAPPAPPAPTFVVEDDVEFIYPQGLGFYVAVGVPYDMVYLQNSYFVYRDGRWLRSPSTRGPWVAQRFRELPPGLRRHKMERIREYRNREYVVYSRDRDNYRGRYFRDVKGERREQHRQMKEQQRELKEMRHDEKRFEKEQRKAEKEQRKEERRYDKEDRREGRGGRGD
jgi:hypothetical protein